jgi:ribose transport system permease protein
MSGGRGKIIGAVIGVLILGVLNNTLNLMNVSPHLQGMVKGLIIVLAVLAQKKD